MEQDAFCVLCSGRVVKIRLVDDVWVVHVFTPQTKHPQRTRRRCAAPVQVWARQGVTCAAGPREPNTVWKCSMRISVKMLMGVRALREMEPWRGQTRFTPNTQARLDGLILLTMLCWDTWGHKHSSAAACGSDVTGSMIRCWSGVESLHPPRYLV